MKALRRVLFAIPFFILGVQAALPQVPNLTGTWQDEEGIRYYLRHLNDRLYWVADQLPSYEQAFYGIVKGNTIQGSWADLPSGRMQQTGNLTLRIDSADRLTITGRGGALFTGSVLTRVGGGGGLSGGTTGGSTAGSGGGSPALDSKILGLWHWFNKGTVTVRQDGTIVAVSAGGAGLMGNCSYDSARGRYVFSWSNGYTDTLTLSPKGDRLDGTNNAGATVWGTRNRPSAGSGSGGGSPALDSKILGLWYWFNKGTVTVRQDGTIVAVSAGGAGLMGNCSYDSARGRYVFSWSNGYTDTLTLSPKGDRLDGTNNAGATVWGTRNRTSSTTSGTSADPWDTPEGQACFDEYIRTVEERMNRWNGDQGVYKNWNLSKPYRINEYGIVASQTERSVGPPDVFGRYKNRYHFMWDHWNKPAGSWNKAWLDGANIPGIREFVLDCLRRRGLR